MAEDKPTIERKNKSKKLEFVAIAVILFLPLIIMILLFIFFPNNPQTLINDPKIYDLLGRNLVAAHRYSENLFLNMKNLHYFHTSPYGSIVNSFRPPGYPLFIALIYLVKINAWKLVILLQMAVFLLSIFLLFKLIKKYFDRKTAFVAAIIYGTNFTILLVNNSFWTESVTLSLLIISAYFYLFFDHLANIHRYLSLIIAGLLFGWLILVRPTFLIYLLIFFLYLIIARLKNRELNKSFLIFLVWACVPILAWSVRSTIVSGSPVLISTNGGINYMLGNNPYNINGRAANWPSPAFLQARGIGPGNSSSESDIDRNDTKEAAIWIVRNPRLFIKMSLSKIQYLFVADNNLFGIENSASKLSAEILCLIKMINYSLLLLFALLGIRFVKNKWIFLWLLPYILIIILTFADSRFAIPLYLPMSILAALAIINISKLSANKLYLIMMLIIFGWQFLFFYPSIIKEFVLAREYYKSYRDSQIVSLVENNFFITDASCKTNLQRVICKDGQFGRGEQLFFDSKGEEISQKQLLDLIKHGQIYTDLVSVFSDIDKTKYPDISNQNNLLYCSELSRPIFKIVPSESLPTNFQIVDGQPATSDWPDQIQTAKRFNTEDDKQYLLFAELDQTSEMFIRSGNKTLHLTNFTFPGRAIFKIIVKLNDKTTVAIKLKNNLEFENLHNYNLFTGQKRAFQINGAQINRILSFDSIE